MENSNTTKASVLEKIAHKAYRKSEGMFSKDYYTLKELGKDLLNKGIKLSAFGITLSGSICYAIGRRVYKFETKMGEDDSDMNKKYELSVRQHYRTKYQTRKKNWTFH